MRYLFPLLLLLAACESEPEKMGRLNRDQMTAELVYEARLRRLDSVVGKEGTHGPHGRVYAESLIVARNNLDLATRARNKFMGR